LTSSLAVILASLSQQQESDLEKKIPDTSGLTLKKSSEQLDLFGASLKTSKDTSLSDSEKSLATWKALVIQRRGEYSRRVKSAHLIRESESTSWPTPRVSSANGPSQSEIEMGNPKKRLETEVIVREPTQWPTPATRDHHAQGLNHNTATRSSSLATVIQKGNPARMWPTPTATNNGPGLDKNNPRGIQQGNALATAVLWESKGWPTPIVQDSDKATKKMRKNHQNNLTAVVFDQESFPTPSARDWKDRPGMAKTAINPDGSERKRNDQLARAVYGTENPISGQLNPDWVEWLMGVPIGWTALDSWETE
jgi:hypothetical protein